MCEGIAMAPQIMVVDDEANVRELVCDALRIAEFETLQANDGMSALTLLRTAKPDLLIIDINMPLMDGFDLVERLRSQNDMTPVLMLSARNDRADITRGLSLGADDYVNKPISPKVLVSRVNALFRRVSTKETSSVMQLDAWNWEDAVVKTDDAVHMNWPSSFRRGRWWMGEDPGLKPNANYKRDIDAFVVFMENAKVYNDALSKEKNAPFQAAKGLFDGSKKLFIGANGDKEIIDAVTAAKKLGVQEVVVVGGAEAYKVIPFLKKHNIAILVEATHNLPGSDYSDYDQPYKLPKLLADGGLLVSIQNADAANFQNRNLIISIKQRTRGTCLT